MFLHLSVSHSVHGGRLPQWMLGYTPLPPGPEADMPPGPEADTPPQEQTPPGAVHAGRYGQQVSGTHPTGMHTCCYVSIQIQGILPLTPLHLIHKYYIVMGVNASFRST